MSGRFRPPTDEERCTAKNRKGERCPKYHIRGATVCLAHGARAPQVRRAAERRVADAKAVELASKIQVEVPRFATAGEVGSYLLGEVHKRSAQFGVLADRLDSATYTDKAGQERVRAVLAEQRRWLDSMAKVLAVAVAARPAPEQAGPDPVELFTMAAGLFRDDVDAALCDAGVYGEQHQAVMAALGARTALRVKLSANLIIEQVRILTEAARG